MNEFQVLLDAPGTPATRVQIAKVGPLSDSRYGDFEISAQSALNWGRNLSALPGGRAVIDAEHRSERKPRDSRAMGWVTGVELDGNKIYANCEWTKRGEKAIRRREYLFVSPAFGPFVNEKGKEFDDVLCSLALTNKPAISDQPTLQLSSPERLEAADAAWKTLDISQADRKKAQDAGNSLPDGSYPIPDRAHLRAAAILAASHHGDWKAARALIKRRAKELGVAVRELPGFADASADDDSDDGGKALSKADRKAKRKLLDRQAAASGMVMLSAKKVRKLEQAAADRRVAQRQLEHQGFEHAFAAAVKARKAVPGQEDGYRRFYALDQTRTLQMLEQAPQIMPDRPMGAPTIDFSNAPPDVDPAAAAAAGFDPNSVVLDQRVQERLRELGAPQAEYPRILTQLLGEES